MKTISLCIAFMLLNNVSSGHSNWFYPDSADAVLTKGDSCTISLNHVLSSEDLQSLPFRGETEDYFALYPDVVNQNYRGTSQLHVRGGRHDEIGYTIEGADVRNAFTGLPMFHIIPEALDSVRFSSAPSASLSHAPALFERRLKRGGDRFGIRLHGESDRFTSPYTQQLGSYSYGYSDVLMTAGGPFIDQSTHFFIAAEWQRFNDHYRKFWEGFEIGGAEQPLVGDLDDYTLQGSVGTDRIRIKPGNIPHGESDRISVNGQINVKAGPIGFKLLGLYDWQKQRLNNFPIRDVFNTVRTPELKERAGLASFQADYSSQNGWRAHAQFDYLWSGGKQYDPVFEDNYLSYYNGQKNAEKGMPWYDVRGTDISYQNPRSMYYDGFPFTLPGTVLTDYKKWVENAWTVSGYLQKKLRNVQFKLGGEYQKRLIRRYDVDPSMVYNSLNYGSMDNWPANILWNYVYTIGYDVWGNERNASDELGNASRHPTKTSIYADSDWRFGKYKASVGLRYVRTYDDGRLLDPRDLTFCYHNHDTNEKNFYAGFSSPDAGLKTSPVHTHLLYRVRLESRLNTRTKFHIDWGSYLQTMRLADTYLCPRNAIHRGWVNMLAVYTMGIQPMLANQYQLGLICQPRPDLFLHGVFFYKRMTKQLGYHEFKVVRAEDDYMDRWGFKSSNRSRAKGFSLSADYKRNELTLTGNYTLSLYNFDQELDAALAGTEGHVGYEFNQKHRINLLSNYTLTNIRERIPDLSLHCLFRINSGHEFYVEKRSETGDIRAQTGVSYSDNELILLTAGDKISTPWAFLVDIKAEKFFPFMGGYINVYVYVQNLLNSKNVINVYRQTGNAEEDQYYAIFDNQADGIDPYRMYQHVNLDHRQHYAMTQGGDLFGHPREIRFGVEVGFGEQ